MQLQSIRKLAMMAGVAGLATLILSAPARADILIRVVSTNNPAGPNTDTGVVLLASGSPTTPGGVNSPAFTGTFGSFAIINGSAGEIQTSALSQAFETALNIHNNSAVAQTLTITLEASLFTAPVPNANVISSFTGTTTTGEGMGSLTSSFQTLGGMALPTQTVNPFGLSFNNTIGGSVSGLSAPFSIFQMVTITLAGGEDINFTARTQLSPSAVPEPGTIAMALTTLPLLGLGAWARRRRAQA